MGRSLGGVEANADDRQAEKRPPVWRLSESQNIVPRGRVIRQPLPAGQAVVDPLPAGKHPAECHARRAHPGPASGA
jgi:hypothetical protein